MCEYVGWIDLLQHWLHCWAVVNVIMDDVLHKSQGFSWPAEWQLATQGLFYELSYPSTYLYWRCSVVEPEVHTSGLPGYLGDLSFVWWNLTFLCPQYGTCPMSLLCCLEFWGGFYIFWKFVLCCLKLWTPCLVLKLVLLISFL